MNLPSRTPSSLHILIPNLAAFAVGLGCAWMLGWQTTDLVWSLWLSSLVLGYLSILATIGKGLYIGSAVVFNENFPAQYRSKAILIGSCIALFVLAFFSLHFCGFHAIHAGFLSTFFPLSGVPGQAFARAFFNPILLWKDAFHYLMPQYCAFLIPVVIAERRTIIGSISALLEKPRLDSDHIGQLLKASGASAHGVFSRPYLNVARMHVLIFFFAFCHALKVDSFPIYAAVYAVYFFPWSILRKDAGSPRQVQSQPS
ncbi:MAG TPA: DUF6498-containing protein [Burkholderiaceae bacterium]|jgi:hypothetical protein|nr:DUF6498-containing protein [Burkholderiaceae bacterium]